MFKRNILKFEKYHTLTVLIAAISVIVTLSYFIYKGSSYLSFSDSAKFAILAKNIINSKGYVSDFIFFDHNLINSGLPAKVNWIPPATPLVMAGFFKLFGVSDLGVILTSSLFYLLSVIILFLIGKELFGNLVGFLSALAFTFNINFLEYATTGASETLFVFEILLAVYLFILKRKWLYVLGFFVVVLLYFTKAQAIVYIFTALLLFLLLNYKPRKALQYFSLYFVLGGVIFIATSKQGLFAITQNIPGIAFSESLRGGIQTFSFSVLLKKVFYNLYNLYKLLPKIVNPYLFTLFVIGLLKLGKNKKVFAFKISAIFMIFSTFILTAITIPLFRYIHPVVPFIYLFAIETLVVFVRALLNKQALQVVKIKFNNWQLVSVCSSILILIFVKGHALGAIFLDSRYESKLVNKDKPPVYAKLSWVLKDNTKESDLIVTNLDTWGSWYGERKTVWFPLEPDMLKKSDVKFDAIYLTSYLMDDENYFMGPQWRQIFENPLNIENEYIRENYEFAGEYEIPADEVYEKYSARAILLRKKSRMVNLTPDG